MICPCGVRSTALTLPPLPSSTTLLLLEGIESIEEGSQVWAVVTFEDFLLPDGIVPPMAVDLIASLERGTYQMRLDSALTGRAVGQFRT